MDEAAKCLLIDELARSLESDLLGRYGPVMGGDELLRALGYTSKEAFRQSRIRNTVAVPLFNLEHRRGKHALVKDVARYLAEQRFSAALGISPNREQGGDPK